MKVVFCALSVTAFVCPTAATRHTARRMGEDVDLESEEFQKALAAMTSFSNRYVKISKTKYCAEPSVPAVVIRGLAEHKITLGAPLCPCRFYEDKHAEAKDGYWNCPCVPMRERKECHCMLFLTEDNDYVGESDDISLEEIKQLTEL